MLIIKSGCPTDQREYRCLGCSLSNFPPVVYLPDITDRTSTHGIALRDWALCSDHGATALMPIISWHLIEYVFPVRMCSFWSFPSPRASVSHVCIWFRHCVLAPHSTLHYIGRLKYVILWKASLMVHVKKTGYALEDGTCGAHIHSKTEHEPELPPPLPFIHMLCMPRLSTTPGFFGRRIISLLQDWLYSMASFSLMLTWSHRTWDDSRLP